MTFLSYITVACVFYALGVLTYHWWRDTAVPAVEDEWTTLRADLADLLRKHGL